jgi:hypothetical protein
MISHKYLCLSAFKSSRNTNILKKIQQLQNKPFSNQQTLNMPLVVPGINSGGDNSKTEEWMNKLAGKKLTDGPSDATVSYTSPKHR